MTDSTPDPALHSPLGKQCECLATGLPRNTVLPIPTKQVQLTDETSTDFDKHGIHNTRQVGHLVPFVHMLMPATNDNRITDDHKHTLTSVAAAHPKEAGVNDKPQVATITGT